MPGLNFGGLKVAEFARGRLPGVLKIPWGVQEGRGGVAVGVDLIGKKILSGGVTAIWRSATKRLLGGINVDRPEPGLSGFGPN